MRFSIRFLAALLILGLGHMATSRAALAHPMGNFSINHYARFEANRDTLALRYILDFAEIPSAERMPRLDANGDGRLSDREKQLFSDAEAPRLLQGVSLQIDGNTIPLRARKSALEVRPGAGGLETLRLVIEAQTALSARATHRITYRDSNFDGRTGWKEIIAIARGNRSLRDSDAASRDQSRALTVFPTDADFIAPVQTNASFTLVATGANVTGADATGADATGANANGAERSAELVTGGAASRARNTQTPQNGFTQSIAARELTPGLILSGLAVALAFGAVHALSPGHGKTMVAAYLVGSRGTPRHAVLLGVVVTITHTFGIFALGGALMFASQTIVPERLFSALGAVSGMLVFGVGLWLLLSRWQNFTMRASHSRHAHDDHSHDHSHEHGEQTHDGHSHSHHDHSHAPGSMHSHGGRMHSHAVPEGPITLKTLVALGISGGIVPCPEALVVLLAAVKLGRLGFGMLLITAFSLGLAAALIAIGLVVVQARQRLSRFDAFSENSLITRTLPLASAAFITVLGIVLILRAGSGVA